MDDVLKPLCARLRANYTPGLGFTSRTRVAEMLQRAKDHGKPVRIFVISDYDPAGSGMPSAIARVVEFYRDLLAPDVEIALHHIGMSRDWADRYGLPRAPIKEEDRRKANFEAIHGEGCVELDALEVLHPGALAREVEQAIAAYRDPRLAAELEAVERFAVGEASAEWHAITEPIRTELAAIHTSVNEITGSYRERLAELDREMRAELTPHRVRLGELWTALQESASEADFALPERPVGQTISADESGWLYDSRRPWWDQLTRYRAEKTRGDT